MPFYSVVIYQILQLSSVSWFLRNSVGCCSLLSVLSFEGEFQLKAEKITLKYAASLISNVVEIIIGVLSGECFRHTGKPIQNNENKR